MKRVPQFVAEVSSNHARDLDRCLAFVDSSADIGCSGVKFQLFKVDELFAPEILERSEQHRARRQWELPISFLPPIVDRAKERGLDFLCTPFHPEAVDELLPFVDAYKVASYELLWTDLLRACSATGKPLVLSTGMATLDEIDTAVEAIRDEGCEDLTLLHCVSGYPTPPEQCNLAAIETLRARYGCTVGWSDHSVSAPVVERAIHRWDAQMIEFHLDLDREGAEYAAGHCWLPEQMAPVIASVEQRGRGVHESSSARAIDYDAKAADGTGEKVPAAAEIPDRDWRADPSDGLRPLRKVREEWAQLT